MPRDGKMMPERTDRTAESLGSRYRGPALDGISLRGRWWRRPSPRGAGDRVARFCRARRLLPAVAEVLGTRLDLDVIAVDYRGHGRSPGRRGVIKRYNDLVGDLASVLTWSARQFPRVPRFILAHSNGGQVALRLALEGTGSSRDWSSRTPRCESRSRSRRSSSSWAGFWPRSPPG